MPEFARGAYEHLLYTLPQQYPEVASSSLHLFTTAATIGLVQGSVWFRTGLELRVRELVDLSDGEILDYSYDVFRDEEPIRWYDPQPHPENPDLASTFPHHYHERPDPSAGAEQSIKHNRKPAPGISFQAPNLPALIADCLALGANLASSPERSQESHL
jgi:hypothetical protein